MVLMVIGERVRTRGRESVKTENSWLWCVKLVELCIVGEICEERKAGIKKMKRCKVSF